MFGASIKSIAIAAALAGAVGYGSGFWAAKDRYDTQAALDTALRDIERLRASNAALEATARAERTRAIAAEFAAEAAAAFGEAQLERAAALEDTIDEILATPGGDAPASDLLLRAIGVRE